MKLKQVIPSKNTIIEYFRMDVALSYRPELPAVVQSAIAAMGEDFWIKNSERELRDVYSDRDNLTSTIRGFLKMNIQKIVYIAEAGTKPFLEIESKTNTSFSDTHNVEDIDYNTDYFGGEGKTGKATGMNTSNAQNNSTTSVLEGKNKLFNFKNSTNNTLFRNLEDKIFETFEIDDDIKW